MFLYQRGSWPRYIGSFSTVAVIRKLVYHFDHLRPYAGTQLLIVLVPIDFPGDLELEFH